MGVNGFASVVGSVLTTIIGRTFGFNVVLVCGLVLYLGALAALRSLQTTRPTSDATVAEPRVVVQVGAGS